MKKFLKKLSNDAEFVLQMETILLSTAYATSVINYEIVASISAICGTLFVLCYTRIAIKRTKN